MSGSGPRNSQYRHGWSRTPEYQCWRGMKKRCGNHDDANYGGRGIRVCARWQTFENFMADMGPRPSAAHSIDRIDNNGNYEPGNCRWATKLEQSQNTRVVRLITHNGRTLPVRAWARELGIDHKTVRERLARGRAVDGSGPSHTKRESTQ